MTNRERYELLLSQAKSSETAGNLTDAIETLKLAQKRAPNSEESSAVAVWLRRLEGERGGAPRQRTRNTPTDREAAARLALKYLDGECVSIGAMTPEVMRAHLGLTRLSAKKAARVRERAEKLLEDARARWRRMAGLDRE